MLINSLHKFINNEQYNAKQQTQVTCVCNKLYVVLSNESENKMKAINFVFSILRQTYPIIAHL